MKTLLNIIIVLALALAFGGCSSTRRALMVTQNIEGSGYVVTDNPVETTTVTVENARQEDGRFKADRIDLVTKFKLMLMRLEVHIENYSRPLIEERKRE